MATKPTVVTTATALEKAQQHLKSARSQEASRERAYLNAKELRIKCEEDKSEALKAHNAAVKELR